METYDAIIAGYGPTGATLANLLGGMGMKVAVVERELGIYDQPRAITADHEALRAFQAVGLAEQVAAGTMPHPGTDFVGVHGDVIKRFYPQPGAWPLGWQPTFMFYQPELERILRAGATRYAVDVLLGHALLSHRQDADGVQVEVAGPGDSRRLLRGRFLLACDGARSGVRTQMQSAIHDLEFDEWWLVVDAQLHGDAELPERCVQYCRPSRPGTYIVGPGRLRRWEIKVLPGESPESFNDPAQLDRALATFVDTSAISVQRVAIYRFHAVVAEQWRDRNVFLLGDAAHQMPPFLGQGLCAGVRDAYNLAWKLNAVLRGQAGDTLLDSYCTERRPHVQTVVEHAKAFGLIIGELDPEAALARDARLLAELAAGTATTVRQAFMPALRDGLLDLGADGFPRGGAGTLFPQPRVHGVGIEHGRLDDLVRGDFYVVSTAPALAALARERLAASPALRQVKVVLLAAPAAARASPGLLICEEDGEADGGVVRRWMHLHGVHAAVVRPDGCAYGGAADGADLLAMLDKLALSLAGAISGKQRTVCTEG